MSLLSNSSLAVPKDVSAAIAIIDGYADSALNAEHEEFREEAAIEVLRMAHAAISGLNRISRLSDTCSTIAPRVEHWPILFNETEDLAVFKKLRVGYDLIDSRDPKKRSGAHAFKWFAVELLDHMQFLRDDATAEKLGESWYLNESHQKKKRTRIHRLAAMRIIGNSAPHLRDEIRISSSVPVRLNQIADLPDFTKETAQIWADEGKALFKQIYPKPESIVALVKMIHDDAAVLPSQKRAQIVARVGRAIVSLA